MIITSKHENVCDSVNCCILQYEVIFWRGRMKHLIWLICLVGTVQAVEFTADVFTDTIDINVGDGQCADSNGDCSLRAAILETNALPGTDTIFLLRGESYVVSIANLLPDSDFTGDLDIKDSLLISIVDPLVPAADLNELPVVVGQGFNRASMGHSTASDFASMHQQSAAGGDFADRIFDVQSGQDVVFFALGVMNGDAQLSQSNQFRGGGIFVGNDVVNFSLLNSYVLGNRAQFGAGLYTLASNNLVSFSDFSYNLGMQPGGNGGSTLGVAIYQLGDTIRIQNTAMNFNSKQSGGGSASALYLGTGTTAFVFSSIISDNGQGIKIPDTSVIGIDGVDANVFLVNATITNNVNGGLSMGTNGGTNTVFMRNSVLAYNNAPNCIFIPAMQDFGDGAGNGHNVSDDNSCNLPVNSNNLQNTDPRLSGLTPVFSPFSQIFFTRYPLAGSPLIDAGSPLPVNVGNPNACYQFDQRLVERPVNGGYETRCDIGAYELNDVIFRDDFEP